MRHSVKEEIALRAQHDRRYYQSLAERLFPREGFYRVMNAADGSMFRRAVELLGAWSEQGKQILSKRK